MTLEQYSAFVEVMPQIELALTKKGERVPRPVYAGGGAAKDQSEESGGMEHDDENGDVKKSNIEATSDEEED
jgi:hypothetical protein